MDLAERPGTTKARRKDARGWLSWKDSIFEITIDGTSTVSNEALDRIMKAAGARHERVNLPNPDSIPFDLATLETTVSLRAIGVSQASLTKVRERLHPFFCD